MSVRHPLDLFGIAKNLSLKSNTLSQKTSEPHTRTMNEQDGEVGRWEQADIASREGGALLLTPHAPLACGGHPPAVRGTWARNSRQRADFAPKVERDF